MARNLFGGSSDDYAVDSTGRPIAVRRVRFYTSAAMTTEVTDLASDAAGTGAPLTVNTDAHGFWGPVYGPDGVTTMYAGTVDSGGNPPAYVVAIYTHTSGGVASFNTRAGAVSLTKADVTATALAAADVGAPNVVVHGSTAGTARPAGATVVHWIGSVAPTNVTGNDEWTDTTSKLLKRWNGSAFDALGSAAYSPLLKGNALAPKAEITQLVGGRAYVYVDASKFLAFSTNNSLIEADTVTDTQAASWTSKGLPTGVTAGSTGGVKIVLFKGNYYGQFIASGVPGIYSAAPVANPTTFTWSAALVTATTGSTLLMPNLNADATAILWAEYGDPSGGPTLRRSTDGTTWTTVLGPLATSRHFHCVVPDPYVPGDWYATVGDTTNPTRVYVSHDSGATWTAVPVIGASVAYQAVQVSFDANYVYFGSDQVAGLCGYKVARTDLAAGAPKPVWLTGQSVDGFAVPGGTPARKVTDLATTQGSTTVTSATAAFTSADVGAKIRQSGQNFVPNDSYIVSVTNGTTVVISRAAKTTGSGLTAVISGEVFGLGTYYGTVDPATGIFYFATLNGGLGGNTGGLFAVYPNGQMALLGVLTLTPDPAQMYVLNNTLYFGGFSYPLLTLAS